MAIRLTPSQSVDKRYLRLPIDEASSKKFVRALCTFFRNYQEKEKEEYNKTLTRDFLREAFYNGNNAINIYGNADSAIYANEHSRGSYPLVLCEAKSPSSSDMIDAEHLNRKALHELILYYLLEEVDHKNHSIKHLVITNGLEWYVFRKKVFLDIFARSRDFVKDVMDMYKSNDYKTDDIYKKVIKPFVEERQEKLIYTYFSLEGYKDIDEDCILDSDAKLRAIYKLLSPEHLLSHLSYVDYNKLNIKFYNELLYILGLEDVAESNSQVHIIKRLSKQKRQYYSLLEQAILKLQDYGLHDDDVLFDTALGLVLEWLNRILFLKLLEGQMMRVGQQRNLKYAILTIEKVPNYGAFYDLCMNVLAKPYHERDKEMLKRYEEVPYLNSSLFELSEQEKCYFSIYAISKGEISLYSQTVLKENGHKMTGKMDSLEYIFRFLGSYDFSSDGSKAVNDASSIINSSVLGLIFEKINGYKDGSFYTPGYITDYICRDVVRQSILDKFSDVKGWKCKSLEELLEHFDYMRVEERQEVNDIINSIKICDPAVGSGHFLVAALNELVYAKSVLHVLQYADNRERLKGYQLSIENGEIVLTTYNGQPFRYNPDDDSKRVQQTLFEEKRCLIENCLYGVDLNRKSVEICRLRLWIELLKSIYYMPDEKGKPRLQTLPNIDINIKCGNTLLSKFPVAVGKKLSSKTISEERIREYKEAVSLYKNTTDKHKKAELRQAIESFKEGLLLEGSQTSFLEKESKKQLLARNIYKDSLEWMIEFPEVLDEELRFAGFDIVIGNPPYVSMEKQKELSAYLAKHKVYDTFDSKGDLYSLFVERAFSLLRSGGLLSYIIPNKWMKVGYGSKMRSLLLKKEIRRLVDFRDNQIFDEATTYTCILQAANRDSKDAFYCSSLSVLDKDNLSETISERCEEAKTNEFGSQIWITSSRKKRALLKRFADEFVSLEQYIGESAKYGIKTGRTDVFVVPESTKNVLMQHPSAKDVIVPFLRGDGMRAFQPPHPEEYLIFLPKEFTRKGMGKYGEGIGKPSEQEAWEWFSDNYPSVAAYMEDYESDCRKRSDKGDYWWELRACTYYNLFSQPKIFYQRLPVRPCFVYEESTMLCNDSVWFMPHQDKRLMALLNSEVAWWLMTEYCPPIQNGCQLNWDNLKLIPVPKELPVQLNNLADLLIADRVNGDMDSYCEHMKMVDNTVRELYGIDENTVL